MNTMTAQSGSPGIVRVRRAHRADVYDILRWRNDETSRSMSRHAESIDEVTHCGWYARALASDDKVIFVGELGDVSVGVVRFDRMDTNCWELSIVVATEARGNKVSRKLLNAAIAAFDILFPSCVLIATIKKCNDASLHLFATAGFAPSREVDGFVTYEFASVQKT